MALTASSRDAAAHSWQHMRGHDSIRQQRRLCDGGARGRHHLSSRSYASREVIAACQGLLVKQNRVITACRPSALLSLRYIHAFLLTSFATCQACM